MPPETLDTIRGAREIRNKRLPLSEFEHTGKAVKSYNLIDLFYDQNEINSYIAKNLYGGYGDLP